MDSINPSSLALIIASTHSGRISPYSINLTTITEKLLDTIIHSPTTTTSHLDALEKTAILLQMKAEFVANGGKFVTMIKSSVFDGTDFEKQLEGSFEALIGLKDFITKNLALVASSYPRPAQIITQSDEFKIPSQTRLTKILSVMAKRKETTSNPIILRRKTIDLKAAMFEILDHLRSGIQILFSMLLLKKSNRFDIITKLLALLELVKRRKIVVYQEEPFGPIFIERL